MGSVTGQQKKCDEKITPHMRTQTATPELYVCLCYESILCVCVCAWAYIRAHMFACMDTTVCMYAS